MGGQDAIRGQAAIREVVVEEQATTGLRNLMEMQYYLTIRTKTIAAMMMLMKNSCKLKLMVLLKLLLLMRTVKELLKLLIKLKLIRFRW